MNEQTILQCARCLTHTPLIETDTAESIKEAIKRHSRCDNCGHYVMLCFESKPVLWRVENAGISRSKLSRRHRTSRANEKRILL